MNLKNGEERPFDVHCHFFNKEVVSLRLLAELGMILMKKQEQNDVVVNDAFSPVKRVIHFLKAGMSSVEKLYVSLEKDESGFAFCPLMFDLEGCMIQAVSGEAANGEPIEQQIVEQLDDLLVTRNGEEDEELRSLIGQWEDREKTERVSQNRFEGEEKQLVALTEKHPGRIFPFFAVDPRRSELFEDPEHYKGIGKIVSRLRMNGGVFAGIKLYAPNGYSPADERLLPLYEYCEAHQVPITAHCSAGGFATFAPAVDIQGLVFDNGAVVPHRGVFRFHHNGLFDSRRVAERARVLNHPRVWDRLLQDFPRLKLDLAHFGLQDSGKQTEWTDCIWDMMHRYPNLYTDFSCVTERSALQYMHDHYFRKAGPEVKARFMYGSDYYLNLLFCNGIKDFLHSFAEFFSPEEWQMITKINPVKFLQTI